jgi:hypothetical protein
MSNVLDAVLAQYEKNQIGGGAQSKMSQDERMKKYFALILGDKRNQVKEELEFFQHKMVLHHSKKLGIMKSKLVVNGKNSMTREKMTTNVHL